MRAGRNERLQEPGRIRGAAAARVVLGIRDHHRALRSTRHLDRTRDAFFRAHHRFGELRLLRLDLAQHPVCSAVGGRLGPGMGDHRGAAPVEVRRREPGEVGKVDQIALDDARARDHALGGLYQRALPIERDQERRLAQRASGRSAALEKRLHRARGVLAGLHSIDVRIGAVGDHRVGVLDHLRRDIGVVVEADHDRHIGADRRPHPAQQLRLRRPRNPR